MVIKRMARVCGILAAAAGAMLATAGGPANANGFPDHDITFIVPYAPGGGSDLQARRLQAGLEDALGVGIRIVYKTGGGGAVGFLELHSAKPDGYTISNVVVPNIILTSQGDNIGYKPTDFTYLGMTEAAFSALAVPKNSRFKDLQSLVAYAKENPGKLIIAGVGATGLANYAQVVHALGIEATYVPVSGGVGKIIPMLQGGHIDSAVIASSHAVNHAGTVTALGISGSMPSPALPGVPTFESLGYDGFTMATTWGLMAPPGTPDDVVATLNDALRKAIADPKVREAQVAKGLTPLSQTPAEAKAYLDEAINIVKENEKLVKALEK